VSGSRPVCLHLPPHPHRTPTRPNQSRQPQPPPLLNCATSTVLTQQRAHDDSSTCCRCRSSQLFCHSPALFKAVFLNAFDPPPDHLAFSFPYRPALVARTRTELRIAHIQQTRELRSTAYSPDERHLFVSALVAAADGRAAVNEGESANQAWLAEVYDENILKRLVPRPTPDEVRTMSPSPTAQLASRLHCLANPATRITHRVRTAAREILYEAGSFGRSSNWGPFMKMARGHQGGLEVDWRKVEALALVMAGNIDDEIAAGWGEGSEPRPSGWESTRKELVGEGVTDWAGVESGTWKGTYAFLDFTSFDRKFLGFLFSVSFVWVERG